LDNLKILNQNETLLTNNFNYFFNDIEFSLVFQLTKKEINFFDIQLKFMISIPLEFIPIKFIFRKRNNTNELFIYNCNNQLLKYDINGISNIINFLFIFNYFSMS